MSSTLADQILVWYAHNARQLPWRNRRDPYAVWVSEIMLQQTRVETVIPYFGRWMARFPNIQSLAAAPLQEVLALWEGLGYYSRARNLHMAARLVVDQHDGKIPAEPKALRQLPGIGRYTAAAIASIAFGLDEPALDGNIRRVLARVFDVDVPARSTEGERRLWELAEENLPPDQAGNFNQALMDLGATICTPRQPECPDCPLKEMCEAYKLGIQEQRPVRKPRNEIPHFTVTAAVIRDDDQVLIAQRPTDGLLGGLWEFPGGKVEPGEALPDGLRREILEELGVGIKVGPPLGVYQHAYTHFRVTLHAYLCSLNDGQASLGLVPIEHSALRWTVPEDLASYPMGKLDRQIANALLG